MPEVYEMCCINQIKNVLKAKNEREGKGICICTLERGVRGGAVG
jgi:hypothetical protein